MGIFLGVPLETAGPSSGCPSAKGWGKEGQGGGKAPQLVSHAQGRFEPWVGSEQALDAAGPGSVAQAGFLSKHSLTARDLKSGPIFSSWVGWVSSPAASLSERRRGSSS